MKKAPKLIVALVIAFLIGIASFIITTRIILALQPEPAFHEHANFALFLDGERFDFNRSEFMSIKPCIVQTDQPSSFFKTAYAHGEEIVGDQLEDWLHLHNNNGDTIHVHKEGMVYHHFFQSLGMKLENRLFTDHEGNTYRDNDEMQFRYFLNNEEVDDLPDREIRDLDRALITYGPRDRSQESINAELVQVRNDACLESGSCSHLGYVAPEDCGDDYQEPWVLRVLGL